MRCLTLNGSPRGKAGNTWQVLQPFHEGLQAAGAEVEAIPVRDLKVQPCTGCFTCWRNGGQCALAEDDMGWLLPKVATADTLILAAPLYVDLIPGPLKTILDRLIPLAEPRIVVEEDRCRHPRRPGSESLRQVVLVSVCGFYELENFAVLTAWVEAVCRNLHCHLAGKLLRPHAYALAGMPRLAPPKAKVLKALHRAGEELATVEHIAPATEAAVATPLLGRDLYLRLANRSWR